MPNKVWPKRGRRWLRALPRTLRVLLAAWLALHEVVWLVAGREPLALRVMAGATVLLGAAIFVTFRFWLLGAAIVVAGTGVALGWHLARGEAPWSLGIYIGLIGGLAAWDASCAIRLSRLYRNFHARRLSPGAFDHAAHLAVALDCARRLGPDEALTELREGLRSMAERAGKPDAYHETRTRAWLALVTYVQRCHADDPLPRLLDRVLAHCRDGRLLERYYSPERLASDEARTQFVPPDLAPLPR